MSKVEFIESYIKQGSDYIWNDNHGELIRCKDCRFYDDTKISGYCSVHGNSEMEHQDYCSRAERKEIDGKRSNH